MTRALRRGATFVDHRAVALGLRFERPALLGFLFHAVFADRTEVESGQIHPQEALVEADFRRFVEHFLTAGYEFVSLTDVEAGLATTGRYVCVTFDDGYANNLRVLGMLREYDVPATIFVTTGNVEHRRRFWWDTLYAERRHRGASEEAIDREIELLERTMQPEAILTYLEEAFGRDSVSASSDLDRPLTTDEVKELAREPLITIGNHTRDHALLSRVTTDEIRDQIMAAQAYLEALVDSPIRTIAYPDGDYDARVVEIARELGLVCGLTTVRRKEAVPPDQARLLELGRFQFERHADLETQLRVARSGIQVGNAARRIRRRYARAR